MNLAKKNNIITQELMNKIGEYLTFRHFFSHAYGFLINEEKLRPLVNNILDISTDFELQIKKRNYNVFFLQIVYRDFVGQSFFACDYKKVIFSYYEVESRIKVFYIVSFYTNEY